MEKLYLDHGKKILKIKFVFAEKYQKEKETLGKRMASSGKGGHAKVFCFVLYHYYLSLVQ